MIDTKYLDAIKRFEGFTPRATWDYAQSSNGYGTKALYEGEVIDRAEADRRFAAEIKSAYDIVQKFSPELDDGAKAALTSLTYNAGAAWTKSGLGQAIKAGDLETAKTIFEQYNKAGGQVLAGLESRRSAEVAWFGSAAANTLALDDSLAGAFSTTVAVDQPSVSSAIVARLPSTRVPAAATTLETAGLDENPRALRADAALMLATILSRLTLSHLEPEAGVTGKPEGARERGLENASLSSPAVAT